MSERRWKGYRLLCVESSTGPLRYLDVAELVEVAEAGQCWRARPPRLERAIRRRPGDAHMGWPNKVGSLRPPSDVRREQSNQRAYQAATAAKSKRGAWRS